MTRLQLTTLSTVAVLCAATPAAAWEIDLNNCLGETYRDPGYYDVIEMCANPPGFPGLPNATDSVSSYYAARKSMLDAHWMWVRDGTSDAELSVVQQCGDGSGTGWFDNGNEHDNVWWESSSFVQSECSSGDIGCNAQDHVDCFFWGVDTRIIAADIVASFQASYRIVNQDSLEECLSTSGTNNHELLWLHEIGHSYGLAHENSPSTVSVMKKNNHNFRNCHVAQSYSHYPHPDDIDGLMEWHHGYSGTKRNLAGSAWYRFSGSDAIDEFGYSVNQYQTFTYAFNVSAHAYYTPPSSVVVRAYAVPDGVVPTFNWSTKQWNLTDFTVIGQTVWNPSSFPETKTVFMTNTVDGSILPIGLHRVWIAVDPYYSHTETDEGDNVFPTRVTVNKWFCMFFC